MFLKDAPLAALSAAVLCADSLWQRLAAGSGSSSSSSRRAQGRSVAPQGFAGAPLRPRAGRGWWDPPVPRGPGQGRLLGLFRKEVASWKEQKAQREVTEKAPDGGICGFFFSF